MRMRIVLALFVALALTVGLATSSASAKPQTISLLEVDTSFAPTGGWDETSGAPTVVTKTHMLCHGAFFLPRGTIEAVAPA
jgi:hypothetical protein